MQHTDCIQSYPPPTGHCASSSTAWHTQTSNWHSQREKSLDELHWKWLNPTWAWNINQQIGLKPERDPLGSGWAADLFTLPAMLFYHQGCAIWPMKESAKCSILHSSGNLSLTKPQQHKTWQHRTKRKQKNITHEKTWVKIEKFNSGFGLLLAFNISLN